MAYSVEFRQIYWKDEQQKEFFPFAKGYYNPGLSPYFENEIIKGLVMNTEADRIAVTSWTLAQKMTLRVPPRRDLTADVLQEDFDVLAFSKNAPGHDMFVAAEAWHRGWKEIFYDLWLKLKGYRPEPPKNPIYQNAFCASREVYQDYVTDFLIPAMEVMGRERIDALPTIMEDVELSKKLWVDSGYRKTILGFNINRDKCQQYFGVPWYPMHAFILERCFSCWIDKKNLKVVYL